MKKIIILILIVVIIGGCTFFEDKEPKVNHNVYDYEETLPEIAQVFYDNELAGNGKYYNKRVKFSATIREIDNGAILGTFVFMDVDGSRYGAACTKPYGPGALEKLLTLKRGDIITVIGTNKGLAGNVMFEECIIP